MSATLPAEIQIAPRSCEAPGHMARSTFTGLLSFEYVKDQLSTRGLRRPQRLRPSRIVTQAQLMHIAHNHPPPAEWFEGEDECPFVPE
jgi:hypothetical protein